MSDKEKNDQDFVEVPLVLGTHEPETEEPSEPPLDPTKLPSCFVVNCRDRTFSTCFVCHRHFCKHHASHSDITLCYDCSNDPKDLSDPIKVDVTIGPLVDQEGVTHNGRFITPIGDTFQSLSFLNDLSTNDAKAMIVEYQTKIKDAEKLMYSRLIVKSTLERLVEDREKHERFKAKAARIAKNLDGSKTVVMPGQPAPKAKAPVIDIKTVLLSLGRAAVSGTPEEKAQAAAILATLKSKI